MGRGKEENERKVLRERVKPSRRRLLAEQTVAVVVLGCGKKVDAMWHTPHFTAASIVEELLQRWQGLPSLPPV